MVVPQLVVDEESLAGPVSMSSVLCSGRSIEDSLDRITSIVMMIVV